MNLYRFIDRLYRCEVCTVDEAIVMSLQRRLPRDISVFSSLFPITAVVGTIGRYTKALLLAERCITLSVSMDILTVTVAKTYLLGNFYREDFDQTPEEKTKNFVHAAERFIKAYQLLCSTENRSDSQEILVRQLSPVYFNLGVLATEVLELDEVIDG